MKRLGNIALLAVVLGAGFALMELAVRIVLPQPASWLSIYAAPTGKLPFEIQRNIDHLIDTGDTRWRILTDDKGYRRPSEPVAPEDAPIVLVVGDSFGFAYGVDYEESFAHHLDVATGTTARVLNVSVPGFGPPHERLRLEEVFESGIRPAAVLLQLYGGNDWGDCVWEKAAEVKDGLLLTASDAEGWKGEIKRNLHLYRAAAKAYHKLAPPPKQARFFDLYQPEAWDQPFLTDAQRVMTEEVQKIKALCEAHGATLFVAFIPTIESVADAAGEPRPEVLAGLDLQQPATRATSMLDALGVPRLDLTPALAEVGSQQTYSSWHRHFLPRGNEVAADAIMEAWTDLKPALRSAARAKVARKE